MASFWDTLGAGLGRNSNALIGLGSGLLGSNNFSDGLANGGQGWAQGAQTDLAFAEQEAAKIEVQEQENATRAWLEGRGFNDLLPLVDAGQAGIAYSEAIKRMDPSYGAGPEPTANMRDFAFAQENPEYANFIGAGTAAESPTLTTIYDDNGREQKGYMNGTAFVPVGSPKASTERPEFNVSQATAAGYADRMAQADAILVRPELAAVQTDITERGKGNIPVIGNMLTSPEFQQAEQAQRDFINAILRRESGAVISDSEFDSARRQYFPQPGDNPAVLEQKSANRRNAINGVARAAGPAYQAPDTTNYLNSGTIGDTSTAPPDVPQELWDSMTPEERGLWQI